MKKIKNKKKLGIWEFLNDQPKIQKPEFMIMMSVPLAVHKITGAINFPGDIPGISARARFIYTKSLSSGITFTIGFLADYLALIVAYETASVADRPGAFYEMNNKTQAILGIVQPLAEATPLRAIGILQSCGFNVIPAHGAHITEFDGVASASVRGAVDLITAGGPDSPHLHLWWVSADGIDWKIAAATNARKVTLTGFEHAKDMYFKSQLSIKDVLQPESNIITVLIN